MEEVVTVTLDDQSTPRNTDEILFDISSVRESLTDPDEENEFTQPQETDKHNPNNIHVSTDNEEIKLNHVIDSQMPDNVTIDNVEERKPGDEAESNSQYSLQNSSINGNIFLQTSVLDENDKQNESVESPDEIQVKITTELGEDFSNKCIEFSDVLENKENTTGNVDGFISLMTVTGEHDKEEDKSIQRDDEADVNLENITLGEKDEDTDSGSEFDFELPAKTSTQPVDPSDKPEVTEILVNNQSPRENKEKQKEENTKPTPNVVHSKLPSAEEEEVKPTEHEQVHESSHGQQTVLEAARHEWEQVKTIQAGYKESHTKGLEPTIVETLTPVSPYELTQILGKEDFSSVKSNIRVSVERKGLAAFVNFLFGPPKLKRHLVEERERIFCVAALKQKVWIKDQTVHFVQSDLDLHLLERQLLLYISQLSNENAWHLRTLQTIYRSLTGSKFDCARFGNHWEEIGFQGMDPSTDLRSVGMLGLVNLLFFLKNPKTQSIAGDIYRLSIHPTQNFPFCVMGINMTRIALQAVREDLLNKECNKQGEVLEVVSEFYAGLYLLLYQIWKGQGKTISDSGFVIKDIEMKAKKSTNEIFKNLEEYRSKKKVVLSDVSPGVETENLQFVNVCENT